MTTMQLVHKKLLEGQKRDREELLHPKAVEKRIEEGARERGNSWAYGKAIRVAGGGWDRSQS